MKQTLLFLALAALVALNACVDEEITEGGMALEVSDIKGRSAKFTGEVSLSGSADDGAISQKGFAWGSDSKALNTWIYSPYGGYSYYYGDAEEVKYFESGASGAGSFEHVAGGLSPTTTYYVKAFAVVNEKTVFGEMRNFKTIDGEPYVTVGNLDVQATDAGKTTQSEAATLCENSTAGGRSDWRLPSIGELSTLYSKREDIGGFKNGEYWSSSPNNNSNNSYYYYYFSSYGAGDQSSGSPSTIFNVRCVRTTTIPSKPGVATLAASNLTESGATLNGRIVSAGEPAYAERGFVYGTAHNPTLSDTKVEFYTNHSDAAYSVAVTGLAMNSTYFVRAYATNSEGTGYGDEVTVTISSQKPVVTTLPVTNIAETSATFKGNIDSKGIPAYTEKGFVYSTTFPEPAVDDDGVTKKTASGTGTGEFSANVQNLSTDATYHVRAYATNSEGTAYGDAVNFTPSHPDYITLQVTGIAVQKTDITPNEISWTNANNLCNNSTLAGHSDWRLPTLDELTAMYNNRTAIGGFEQDSYNYFYHYWSSTPHSTNNYYTLLNMTTGTTRERHRDENYAHSFYSSDYYYNRARCVRTLP